MFGWHPQKELVVKNRMARSKGNDPRAANTT